LNLSVSASSDDPTVIANSGISLTGSGDTRFINITPVANASNDSTQPTTITVTVTDGTLVFQQQFTVTVKSVNDLPTATFASPSFNQQPAISLNPSLNPALQGPFTFTVNDVETPIDLLTVAAVSTNTTLIPQNNITLSPANPDGIYTISFTPAANVTGT